MATPAFVRQAVGTASPLTITGAASGNVLILFVASQRSPAARTVSSIATTNVTWAKVANLSSGVLDGEIWYGIVAGGTSGTSVTLTMSGTGSTLALNCTEFSGVLVTGTVLGATAVTNSGSSTTATIGAFTGLQKESLLVAAEFHADGTAPSVSPGASWNSLTFQGNAAVDGVKGAYVIDGTAANSQTASWTINNVAWRTVIGELRSQAITISVFDATAATTESVTNAVITTSSVNDSTAATTESTTIVAVDIISKNDSSTVTEDVAINVYKPSVFDAVTVTESVTLSIILPTRNTLRFLGHIAGSGSPNFLDGANAVAVTPDGKYAFVVSINDNSLSAFNVTDVFSPTFISKLSGTGSPNFLGVPVAVIIDGNYVYAVSQTDLALIVVDVSNIVNNISTVMTTVGHIAGSGAPNFLDTPTSLYKVGNLVYVVSTSINLGGLSIFDVSTPSAPAFLGNVQDGGVNILNQGQDVVVDGDYAYIPVAGDTAMAVYNISVPTAPAPAGFIVRNSPPNDQLVGANGIAKFGNYVFVVCTTNNALTVVDVTNPNTIPLPFVTWLRTSATQSLGVAAKIKISGSLAVITAFGGDALTVVDVTTAASPLTLGSISGAGSPNFLDGAIGISLLGSYAYVAARNDDSLSIFQFKEFEINVSDSATTTESVTISIVSSTGLDVSVNDTITTTESVTVTTTAEAVSVFDSSTSTESIIIIAVDLPSVFDSSTITENINESVITTLSASDLSTVTENFASSVTTQASVFDSSSVAEAVTFSITELVSVFNASTVTEAVTIIAVDVVSVFDSSTVTENFSDVITTTLSVFDAATGTESVVLSVISNSPSVFDSATVTESTDIKVFTSVSVFDASTVTEAVILLGISFASVFDASAVTEATTVIAVDAPNVFDSSTVTETTTEVALTNINVSDESSVIEIIIFPGSAIQIAVLEVSNVTESITLQISDEQLSVFDTTTVSEVVTAHPQFTVSVFDASATTEAITVQSSDPQISVFDVASTVELVTITPGSTPLSVLDAVTVAENVSITVTTSISVNDDAATVSEVVSLLIPEFLSVSDTVNVSEYTAINIFVASRDVSAFDTSAVSEDVSIIPFFVGEEISVFDSTIVSEGVGFSITLTLSVVDLDAVSENLKIKVRNPPNPPGNTRFKDILADRRSVNLQVGWKNVHA